MIIDFNSGEAKCDENGLTLIFDLSGESSFTRPEYEKQYIITTEKDETTGTITTKVEPATTETTGSTTCKFIETNYALVSKQQIILKTNAYIFDTTDKIIKPNLAVGDYTRLYITTTSGISNIVKLINPEDYKPDDPSTAIQSQFIFKVNESSAEPTSSPSWINASLGGIGPQPTGWNDFVKEYNIPHQEKDEGNYQDVYTTYQYDGLTIGAYPDSTNGQQIIFEDKGSISSVNTNIININNGTVDLEHVTKIGFEPTTHNKDDTKTIVPLDKHDYIDPTDKQNPNRTTGETIEINANAVFTYTPDGSTSPVSICVEELRQAASNSKDLKQLIDRVITLERASIYSVSSLVEHEQENTGFDGETPTDKQIFATYYIDDDTNTSTLKDYQKHTGTALPATNP